MKNYSEFLREDSYISQTNNGEKNLKEDEQGNKRGQFQYGKNGLILKSQNIHLRGAPLLTVYMTLRKSLNLIFHIYLMEIKLNAILNMAYDFQYQT